MIIQYADGQKKDIKYIFTAGYKDGTTYSQNVQDVSVFYPEKSCFADVKVDELAWFQLESNPQYQGEDKPYAHTYRVDLIDGHFEIDGIPFRMHEYPMESYKLIYFRRHRHNFNLAFQEKSHDVVYRFGWQGVLDKKNHQQVMEID